MSPIDRKKVKATVKYLSCKRQRLQEALDKKFETACRTALSTSKEKMTQIIKIIILERIFLENWWYRDIMKSIVRVRQ